jgi:hypothetical protein
MIPFDTEKKIKKINLAPASIGRENSYWMYSRGQNLIHLALVSYRGA